MDSDDGLDFSSDSELGDREDNLFGEAGAEEAGDEDDRMKFCIRCNNLMTPQKKTGSMDLVWKCKSCDYTEPCHTHCVYENKLIKRSDAATRFANQEMTLDPTLPRTSNVRCKNEECRARREASRVADEAVFFQDSDADAKKMALTFICCHCYTRWTD